MPRLREEASVDAEREEEERGMSGVIVLWWRFFWSPCEPLSWFLIFWLGDFYKWREDWLAYEGNFHNFRRIDLSFK